MRIEDVVRSPNIDECSTEFVGRPPSTPRRLRSPPAVERASPRSRDGRQRAKLGKRRIDQPVVGADSRDAGIRKAVGQAAEHRVDARELGGERFRTDTGIMRQAVEAGIVECDATRAPRPQPSSAACRYRVRRVARSRNLCTTIMAPTVG